MSTVIFSAVVSLDGMADGPGEGAERIDWFRADDEWLDYSVEILDAAGVPWFAPGRPRLELDTVGTRIFGSGVVEIRCSPRATS